MLGMTQLQPSVSCTPNRSQLFYVLEKLEIARKVNPASAETASEQRLPSELVEPLVSVLTILENSFVPLWSAIERQALSSIRRKVATAQPQSIVNDLHTTVMGLLDRWIHEEAPIDEYVEILQLMLAVTHLMDVVLGAHIYHLDADEFPWLRVLFGQKPEDCPIELDSFILDTRTWVIPEDTRTILEQAIRQGSWQAARDHLRKELNFVGRPAHAVRLLFALWTIEMALLNQATTFACALLPN